MMPVQFHLGHTERQAPLRILLADDNEVLRAAIRGLLRSLGHSVQAVSNGLEAIGLAVREEFDLVLLDIQMPEMGGLEVTRLLRHEKAGEHRPLIVGLSAEGEESKSYADAGMDDFLVKPISLNDLVRVTKRYARHQER